MIVDQRAATVSNVFDDGETVDIFDGGTVALTLSANPAGPVTVTDRRNDARVDVEVEGRQVTRPGRGAFFGMGGRRWRAAYPTAADVDEADTDESTDDSDVLDQPGGIAHVTDPEE